MAPFSGSLLTYSADQSTYCQNLSKNLDYVRASTGTAGLPSKHNPADCLADIIENAERIDGYVSGMDRNSLGRNELVRDAVERCLERICEATYRLGDLAAQLVPGQPWNDIRGLGNKLRHAYDRISLDVIWHIVHQDLPSLTADVRCALDQLEGD